MPKMPLLSIYPATKAFNHSLNLGYSSEDRSGKIDYLCLMPGYVSTKMTFERKRSDTISS